MKLMLNSAIKLKVSGVQKLTKRDHLNTPLDIPVQSFYIITNLGKLHDQFANLSEIDLYDLLKTCKISDYSS